MCLYGRFKEKDLHINIDARKHLFVTKKWLLSEKNKALLIRVVFLRCSFLAQKWGMFCMKGFCAPLILGWKWGCSNWLFSIDDWLLGGGNGEKTEKKRTKWQRKDANVNQKWEKLKKKWQNGAFYCVFFVKLPEAQASLLHCVFKIGQKSRSCAAVALRE